MRWTVASLLVVAAALQAAGALAQDSPEKKAPLPEDGASGLSVTAGMDFFSAYVWRGITLTDGWVMQPSIDIGGMGVGSVPIGLNIWSDFNLSSARGTVKKGECTEVDLTLSADLGKGFEAGFIEYLLSVDGRTAMGDKLENTGEVYISWSKEMAVTPTIAAYYDVQQVHAGFLLASLAHTFELSDKASLSVQGDVGVADGKFARANGGDEGGFYHYNVSARFAYQPGARVGLYASLGYTDGFDRGTLPDQAVHFYGGAGLSISF